MRRGAAAADLLEHHWKAVSACLSTAGPDKLGVSEGAQLTEAAGTAQAPAKPAKAVAARRLMQCGTSFCNQSFAELDMQDAWWRP